MKLIREVKPSGNGAHITLPKRYIGMEFQLIPINQIKTEKVCKINFEIPNNLKENEKKIIEYLMKPIKRKNTISRISRELKITPCTMSKYIDNLHAQKKIIKKRIDGRTYEIKLNFDVTEEK